ncbi:MAG TPA: hypothetical protein VHZ56_13325 [Devosia sp.]|jgi:hypothetical protein|nr:hypothetical protein [Devosia sp.]
MREMTDMEADVHETTVIEALLRELAEQGQGGVPGAPPERLKAYPIKGTIDVVALAEAVENALRGMSSDAGKSPAELNAANDG